MFTSSTYRPSRRSPRGSHTPASRRSFRPVRSRSVIPLAVMVALVTAQPAAAAPADLDAGFGTAGIVTVDDGGAEYAYDMAVQPDGKIIGVGASDGDALVFRLNV